MKQVTGFDTKHSVLSFEDCRLLAEQNQKAGVWSREEADRWLEELQKVIILKQRKESSLVLKPVLELLDKSYFVDKYQRGYKWNRQQVRELLDDIDRFAKERNGSFYCLQPVVVKYLEKTDKWELIDGQQRMTTIYLILSCLGRGAYDISYETRESSSDFLKNIVSYAIESDESWDAFVARTDKAFDNVDNYHFFQAYQTIIEWFAGKEIVAVTRWYETLLQHTKVIWYDAWTEGLDILNAIDIFMRINSGKIPLTNAELIKAYFLHNVASDEDEKVARLRQVEMAQEWDAIEQRLQDDDVWYFLSATPETEMPNRIEFIFDILAKKPVKNDNAFYTFDHYLKCTDILSEWKALKQCYEQLIEWYEHYEKYHLVGFVVSRRLESVSSLLEKSKRLGKTAFTGYLKVMIKEGMQLNEGFEDLRYGEDNKRIIDVLLLFNILTLLKSHSSMRFSFERFIKETWSLEHIHAQNSEALSDVQKAESWYLETRALVDSMKSDSKVDLLRKLEYWWVIGNKKSDNAKQLLGEIQKALYLEFGEEEYDEAVVHGVENMALLDKDTNSALNNAIFEVKRRRIIEKDKKGIFIPICTKNVFSKYYSSDVTHMHYWSRQDRVDYKQALHDVFNDYFQEANA